MFLIKFMDFLKQKGIIFLTLALLGVFVFIAIVFTVFQKESAPNESPVAPTPTTFVAINPPRTPLPVDLEKNYSNLNKVVPGKSTFNDVKKLNGAPQSVSRLDDKTYLYYKTPLERYINKVLIEKNIVVYSVENVFGSYRGKVSDYSSKYGLPDITLFEKGDSYSWYVYLNEGIAIENDGKDVGAILYFIPQNKNSFMQTIARELNFVSDPLPEE